MGSYVFHNSPLKKAVSTKGMQKLERQVAGLEWTSEKH